MEFNDKEKASLVKQEILQALHDENKRLGLYDDVYAVETLEQENRLLRARNERLEKELAMYQVQRLGQEIQPEQEPVAWMHNSIRGNVIAHRPADIDRNPDRWIALYTTPPQRPWVGLTDEEENEYNYLGPDMHWVIQEIEAKLKEKNT